MSGSVHDVEHGIAAKRRGESRLRSAAYRSSRGNPSATRVEPLHIQCSRRRAQVYREASPIRRIHQVLRSRRYVVCQAIPCRCQTPLRRHLRQVHLVRLGPRVPQVGPHVVPPPIGPRAHPIRWALAQVAIPGRPINQVRVHEHHLVAVREGLPHVVAVHLRAVIPHPKVGMVAVVDVYLACRRPGTTTARRRYPRHRRHPIRIAVVQRRIRCPVHVQSRISHRVLLRLACFVAVNQRNHVPLPPRRVVRRLFRRLPQHVRLIVDRVDHFLHERILIIRYAVGAPHGHVVCPASIVHPIHGVPSRERISTPRPPLPPPPPPLTPPHPPPHPALPHSH